MRIALIGSGGIGRKHLEELQKLGGVTLVAAADVNFQNAINLEKQFHLDAAYADWHKMLHDRNDIDAVSVCTPNGHHAEPTIAALERGLHVLVEKPMATTVDEAQRMQDAAQRSGKTLVVGFQYRFDEKTRLIKDQIDAGVLGEIMYCRVTALRRRGIPNWGVFGRRDIQGGGPLIDWGIHALDVAHFLMGGPEPVNALGNMWTYLGNQPDAAHCAWRAWDHENYTVEDLAVGSVRFNTGQLLNIESSFAAHIEKDEFEIQVFGTKGGARWSSKDIFIDRDGYMWNAKPGYLAHADVWQEKMKHFVEVCNGSRTNISSGVDGVRLQKIMEMIYRSADEQNSTAS